MEGVFDIMLSFGQLRNIDLYRQGLYAFRVSCYTIQNNPGTAEILSSFANVSTRNTAVIDMDIPKEVMARPYRFIRKDTFDDDDQLTPSQAKASAARYDSDMGFIYTRMFRIQFNDQTNMVDESFVFRVNLDMAKKPELYFDVCLLFAELHSEDYLPEMVLPDHLQMQIVSRRLLRLQGIYDGLHDFFPMTTADSAFATVEIVVHSQLNDFSFFPQKNGNGAQTLAEALFPLLIPCIPSPVPSGNDGDFLLARRPSLENKRHPISTLVIHAADAFQYYSHSLLTVHNAILQRLIEYSRYCSAKEHSIFSATSPIHLSELRSLQDVLDDGKPEEELCCEKAAWRIRRELWTLSSRVFSLWNSLVDLLPNIFRVLVTKLWDGFITNNYERFGSCIFRQTFEYSNRFCSLDRQTVKTRQRICNAVRSSQSIGVLGRGPIEDMTLISNVMDHAVMFEERFLQKVVPPTHGDNLSPRESRVRDVIIFVHGYQGSSGDLRLFKNTLLMKTSGLLTLLSTSNEMDTECSIHDMGVRLALEIQSFVMANILNRTGRRLGRVSFVCHSLGGLIARSALTHPCLNYILGNMYTFLALGSPHLGYVHENSPITEAGMWLLRKLSKSESLSQLSLLDASQDMRQSYVYQLSLKSGLEYFRNVLLVASHQDTYVPHSSAMIQLTPDNLSKKGILANEMATNLLAKLEAVNLVRFHVNFVASTMRWSVDQLIGRSAHISFLDQPLYIHMLTYVYHDYFARSPSPIT